MGDLLRREGLVAESRRRPRREPHPGPPQIAAKEPNDLLTKLSVWWLRLGAQPIRTDPASPEERCARAPPSHAQGRDRQAAGGRSQRAAASLQPLPCFYNDERPHEALDQATPASRYRPSPRPYPAYVPEPEYPDYCQVFTVDRQGTLYVGGELKCLSSALAGEHVGMEEADDGIWIIYFCRERLARYDERTRTIER